MKLFITDYGDPSVGIFMQVYAVDCPFDESIDEETREWFRDEAKQLYKEFADGRIECTFSDEHDDD